MFFFNSTVLLTNETTIFRGHYFVNACKDKKKKQEPFKQIFKTCEQDHGLEKLF